MSDVETHFSEVFQTFKPSYRKAAFIFWNQILVGYVSDFENYF